MESSHTEELLVAEMARMLPVPCERDLPHAQVVRERLVSEFQSAEAAAKAPSRMLQLRGRTTAVGWHPTRVIVAAATAIVVGGAATLALLSVGTNNAGHRTGDQVGAARLAAWTVQTSPGGSLTVTLRQLSEAADLQRVLAENRVNAVVRFGVVCGPARGASMPQISKVLGFAKTVLQGQDQTILRIDPAAIPAGSKLVFSVERRGDRAVTGMALVPLGMGVTCSSSPRLPKRDSISH
jgi:hypothetical protein